MLLFVFSMLLIANTMVFEQLDSKVTADQQKVIDGIKTDGVEWVGKPLIISRLKINKDTKGTIYLPLANRKPLELKKYTIEDGESFVLSWTEDSFMVLTNNEGHVFVEDHVYLIKNIGDGKLAMVEVKQSLR